MSRGLGLRDLRGSSATSWRRRPHIRHDAHGEWNTGQAFRLDSPNTEEAQSELNSIREGKFWDDVKGGWLDPVLIGKAREEDMQYVKKHPVYEKVPISQADTNKGTPECPYTRSRWLAKENNTGSRPNLFSATSTLEGVKLVMLAAASSNQMETVLLVIDVRKLTSMQRRGAGSRSSFPKETEKDWALGSVGC